MRILNATCATAAPDGGTGGSATSSAATDIAPGTGDDVPLPTFFINRDRDTERRAAIEGILKEAGIVPERIRGVDGLAVPEEFKSYFFSKDGRLQAALSAGEVGCYASHLEALKTVIARGVDYALILEDDALVPSDIRQLVHDIVGRLPASWDVVHLCGIARRAIKPIAKLDDERMLVRYSRIPSGAFGYLISRAGAKKLLTPTMRYWPFDTDLRRPWVFNLQVYGITPRAIGHNDATASVILAHGERARARRGLPIPSRSAWTGNPLHCPEGVYFNFKTLGPIWWTRCWLENINSRMKDMLHPNDAKCALDPTARDMTTARRE